MLSRRGSTYGFGYGSEYGYPSGAGGYDMGGVWRPHSGRSEVVFEDYPDYYNGMDMAPYHPGLMSAYNTSLLGDYYQSPVDYYGSYQSLGLYEEQLRRMAGISESERLARWQSRLEFEELCEEERALRYQVMAEAERMRLGLMGSSYWGSRYGGYGYDSLPLSGSMSSWGSSRMPLSSSLATRYGPLYGSVGSANGYGYGYGRGPSGGYGIGRNLYGLGSVASSYGGHGRLGLTTGSAASNIYKAEVDEARRLRRHARECARQARRHVPCY